MIAFVFSGGGSGGAMEAGGVKALYERGIRPDIVVGSSAGAMNAAFLAIDPTPEGVERLCTIWRNLRTRDIVPGNAVSKLWRVVSVALHQDLLAELKYAAQLPGIKTHHIIIRGVPEAGDFDFDHGGEMVDTGYEAVRRYLVSLPPGELGAYLLPTVPAVEAAPPPPGAEVWTPPSR
jgi:predicted acylesterase/phospholipase RssA